MSEANGTVRTQETLENISKALNEGANTARVRVVKTMRDAAGRIRDEIAKQENMDDDARREADKVLSRLDDVSDYLEQNTAEQIGARADQAVRENAWRALLVAFLVGFFVAWLLKD